MRAEASERILAEEESGSSARAWYLSRSLDLDRDVKILVLASFKLKVRVLTVVSDDVLSKIKRWLPESLGACIFATWMMSTCGEALGYHLCYR